MLDEPGVSEEKPRSEPGSVSCRRAGTGHTWVGRGRGHSCDTLLDRRLIVSPHFWGDAYTTSQVFCQRTLHRATLPAEPDPVLRWDTAQLELPATPARTGFQM